MTILILFISLSTAAQADSLYLILNTHPNLATVLELHALHLKQGQFTEGFALLRKFEEQLPLMDRSNITYAIGNTYLYVGDIRQARIEYLRLISQDPNSVLANDALERIYLIEATRRDTFLLKRLARGLYLCAIEQDSIAEDSMKQLLSTEVGSYAYYHLALLYSSRGDFPEALAALDELNKKYPDHAIHTAHLLLAEVHIKMGKNEEARHILENIVVGEPQSIYAARAREMLLPLE